MCACILAFSGVKFIIEIQLRYEIETDFYLY